MVAGVIGAHASPMCVSGGTLASYQLLGLGGCFYNDLFLSNFAFSTGGSATAQAIANTAISVNLVNNNAGGVGLDFNGAFNLNGTSTTASSTLTYTITYTVSAPVSYFHGVQAVILNASADTRSTSGGANSAVQFSKSLKNGTGCTGTYAACTGALVQSPSVNVSLTDTTNTGGAVTAANITNTKDPFSTGLLLATLYVNDQLSLTASKNATSLIKGNASITDMENFFMVPEPGTGLLGGSLGFGLILLSRLRRRKS
jgi:hypothetical protein